MAVLSWWNIECVSLKQATDLKDGELCEEGREEGDEVSCYFTDICGEG